MDVMALVRDVNETLATIKGNVKRTSEVLAGWVANPMFDRKEGKVHRHAFLLCTSMVSPTPQCARYHLVSMNAGSLATVRDQAMS